MADRSVLVRLRADISDFQRKMATAGTTTSAFVKQLDSADSRMGNLVQTALALGPALVPISAAGVPALVGLTSQLGFAAAGAGALVAAFNGVGDALEAVNEYQLNPTSENLLKMQETMAALPVSARQFVRFLDGEVMPVLDRLQDTAADGALPGVQEGIDDLLTRVPQIRRIVDELATGAGDLAAEMGEGLASDEFDEFFRFLEAEAQPTLMTFGRTVGNVFDGLATSLIGLNPLANDFEDALLGWSRGFADIEPEDFAGFVDYVRDVGPDALDALEAIGSALLAVVKAAAPVGSVALPVIEALADTLRVVAQSPAGPILIGAAAGLSAVSRAVALFNAANGSALAGFLGKAGKDGQPAGLGLRAAAAGVAALALSATDLDDNLGVSNTTMLAAVGLMGGPWGAAIGAGAGALLDLAAAGDDSAGAIEGLNRAISSGDAGDLERQISRARDALDEALNPDSVADFATVAVDGLRILVSGMDDSGTEFGRLRAKIQDAQEALSRLNGTRGVNPLFAEGLGLTGDALDAATSSANDFRESLARVNRALAGRASLRDYQAALDDFTDSVKENGRTLDIGTEKGRKNQAALDNIAVTALEVAGNLRGMNRVRVLDQARDDFIDAARKLDIPRARAEALATQLGLLDKQRVRPKIDADNKPARGKVDEAEDWILAWGRKTGKATVDANNKPAKGALDFIGKLLRQTDETTAVPQIDINDGNSRGIMAAVRAELARLDGMTATTYVVTKRVAGSSPGFGPQSATGNAYGDVKDRHDPEIAPGGAWRVWAEPETMGESYIPHANDHRRPRARRILEDTAAILGARSVEWYATGGSTSKDPEERREEEKERREDARRRAEERRQRAEEKRQRQLDKQRTKDLLASDLRDEQEQARLEVKDAVRRLRSAREAGRPKSEILDARLAVKTERRDLLDMRAETQASKMAEKLLPAATRQQEAAEIALQAAEDQVRAAEDQVKAAEDSLSATQQLRDSLDSSVSSQFSGSLTGGGLSGLTRTLNRDINAGSTMDATLRALAAAGLDTTGPLAGLFQELAASEDLKTANQLLAGGPGLIDQLEKQYGQRSAINAARGDFVADSSYGALLAEQTAAVAIAQQAAAAAAAAAAHMQAQLDQANANLQTLQSAVQEQATQIGEVINNTAATAVRGGRGWR